MRPLLRVIVPIGLLLALAGVAFWFQTELTGGGDGHARAATRDTDWLHLQIGGSLPELRIPAPAAPRPANPVPGPSPRDEPRPTTPPQPEPPPQPRRKGPAAPTQPELRHTTLRDGETIYEVCRRLYQGTQRVPEVLKLNRLTPESARHLPAGTPIYYRP